MAETDQPKVTAILLAAGESRRMGPRNKLFLVWDGEPMIIRAINQLQSTSIYELVVVLNPDNKYRLDDFHVKNIKAVINPDYQQGMTTSIQKGVERSDPKADGYMICMSDQPLLSSLELDQLICEFSQVWSQDKDCIVVPFHDGRKGNPVIFSSAYKNAILEHQEMEGCKGIVKANGPHVHKAQINSKAIHVDVDTPEDYRDIS